VNRLAGETSPYLLQHAHNPVDWYPWGDEALALAREQDRPILLSIGYAACHWCHVMERESFEHPATADLMNRLFVNIKVDREERPDLDAVYMNAVVQFTNGHGGWPMTMFLTPDGRPFHGGTYFPPESRMGMPAFSQVLEAVAQFYRERREEVDGVGGRMAEYLNAATSLAPGDEELSEQLLTAGVAVMRRAYDERWGGFGRAPKFPPASAIEYLLRVHRRGVPDALEMASGTLDGMALGGMYDAIGGGFARYSVDERWLIPHFEKMLYDNALLAAAYLHGWVVTGNDAYRAVAEETIDFMLRDLMLPEGVFASALDADTEGEEGLTYVWTRAQLVEALGEDDGDAAAGYYGVADEGNFEHGTSALRPSGEPPANLADIRRRLLERRAQRPQPARDDKAIAAWNGLALSALAEAAWRLGREDLLAAARRLGSFLLDTMTDERGRLLRSYRAGQARITGYLDDQAAVALGVLDLYTATSEPRWLEAAERLVALTVEHYRDHERGGFFYTADDGEQLIARHKELDDNPTPSGQSLIATALLRLARLRGDDEMEALATGVLQLAAPYMERSPHGLGQALSALDLHLSAPREIAVIGPPGDRRTEALVDAARSGFHPDTVYAFGDGASQSELAVLQGKTLVDGEPAVYICEGFVCRVPLTDAVAVAEALR
jgi:uncharacterized protein YyaL (SSP411 family)